MGLARYGAVLALFAAGAAVGAAAAPSAYDLAGRYTHRFENGDISGARFTSTDTVLIVAVGRRRAYVDLHLNFFNGHECSIGGMAGLEDGRLVLRDPQARGHDGAPCMLSIWRDGARLRWTDGDGSCRSNCGARGSLSDGAMRWSSRRAVARAEQARILRNHERDRSLP
ncbi:MAG TPA: hypothetical protein VES64_09535 [Allosphingosinicella sp.]|nr:hypothetical protein [Allosphingosinicella sp.]